MALPDFTLWPFSWVKDQITILHDNDLPMLAERRSKHGNGNTGKSLDSKDVNDLQIRNYVCSKMQQIFVSTDNSDQERLKH